MRKKYAYIAVLVSIILTFSSCGRGKNNGGNKDNGDITLTVSTFYEGDMAEAYEQIIEAFEEKNKNINVKLIDGPIDYDERLDKALKEGKGPDIMGLQRSVMIKYINEGHLEDISSWVGSQGIKDKYYGVNLGYGLHEGKYYGIGDYPQPVVWFYNVDMFEKLNLEEPKNFNDLVDASKKLKKYTQIPIILGAKDPWVISTFFGMVTSQIVDTDQLSQAAAVGDKAALEGLVGIKEAIGVINELVKSGALEKKVTNYDYAQSIDMFVRGKSAILPMGAWSIERIEKEKPKGFKYKIFEQPVILAEGQGSPCSATAIQVMTVNKNSKHKEEAMEFMSFLLSEEAQKIFKERTGISGMKSVNKSTGDSIKDQVAAYLEFTDENSTMYVDNIPPKMMEATAKRLTEMINGKIKESDVWKKVVEESIP